MQTNINLDSMNLIKPHPIVTFLMLATIGVYLYIYTYTEFDSNSIYPTLSAVSILISISLLIFSRPVWGLSLLTFMLPLTQVWPDFFRTLFANIPLITSFIVIIGILTIGSSLVHLAEKKILKIGWSKEITIATLFVLWIIFSDFNLSTTPSEGRIWAWTYIQLLGLMILGATLVTNQSNFLLIRYGLVFGTVISSIGGVVVGGFRVSETATFGVRLAGLHDNPTEFAILCVLSLVCLNFIIPDIKNTGFKTINIMAIFPLLFGLVFSISRTGLIAAIAVIVLLLAIKFRVNLGIIFVKTVPIAIFTLGFILTLLIMPGNYRDLWFGSISSELIENSGTTATRIEVWSISIDLFKENPIKGVGIGNFSSLAKERWTLAKRYKGAVVHNSYLSILSQTGLVGLLLYLSWNISLIRKTLAASINLEGTTKIASNMYTLLFFLLVWGIFGMFTSVEYGKFYWLMSGVAIGLTNNLAHYKTSKKTDRITNKSMIDSLQKQ